MVGWECERPAPFLDRCLLVGSALKREGAGFRNGKVYVGVEEG